MEKDKEKRSDENWWASVLADESGHIREDGKSSVAVSEEEPLALDWEKAQRLYKDDALVFLQVVGHNQGGILVEGENLKGFVPYSHLIKLNNGDDPTKREEALAAYRGENLKLKLIECLPKENRIIFSERAAQVGAGRRQELFATLTSGKVVEGEVTNITDFGVFVDLGGVEGLVHISELSWGRVEHPRQVVQMGKKIQVQILNLSPERCRVALSLKRLADNPWEKSHQKYQLGQIVPAEITTLVSFGAFARLEAGIEGLIHSSEVPPAKRDLLEEGILLKVKILQIEAEKQRMSLSLNFEENYG